MPSWSSRFTRPRFEGGPYPHGYKMDNVIELRREPELPVGVRKVDVSRGKTSGVVSSQWWRRPEDERYLDLASLYDRVRSRAEASWHEIADSKTIKVLATRDDPHTLRLALPTGEEAQPTHWAFGQLCQTIGFPASHYRLLPAPIAAIPLQYGLLNHRGESVKVFGTNEEGADIRAITSPTYGRILDAEVVEAVMKTTDTGEWKVPGTIDWSTGKYDPNVPVTKRSTTLYASDRDVFVFLCRDQYPIEVGKLPDGSPDLLFPGFVVSNSEVGSRSFVIETMYLRAVCCNRNLWGVEHQATLRVRHTSGAPERFALEAQPKLEEFARQATQPVVAKVIEAKNTKIASDDDDRRKFLGDAGFSKKQVDEILDTVLSEDGRPAESVWDFVQGVAAFARDIPFQDERIAIERLAGRWMDRIKV